MYFLFLPAILGFIVIAIIYIKNDLNAFTGRQLRVAAVHVFIFVAVVLAVDGVIKAMGR